MNVVVLRGRLSRPPEHRELPSGDQLVAYEVTVERSGEGEKAESVPVVCSARGAPADLEPDTEVVVVGRVRRRFFRAGGATQSRTEVVAEAVVRARNAKRVATLVGQVVETLGGSPK
jgi:single-strand DNA-binding protein